MLACVTRSKAVEIATRFFEQYHNGVRVVDAILTDDIWEVTISIGTRERQIRKAGVDVNSGKIRCYI
ncbi:MAG: hypothetical protein ACM3UQ_00050 [Clostridiales bacterium]